MVVFLDVLGQLIADERMLSPGWLIEREDYTSVIESLADQVTTLGRDVSVLFAEDLGKLRRSWIE